MKNLILQPFGIGDVIFTQELIRKICTGKIIWPIMPQFLDACSRAYPLIMWVDVSEYSQYQNTMTDCVRDGMRIIPIRHANTIQRVPYSQCMRSKYDMFNLDWQTWRNALFMRDSEREERLFALLDIKGPYRLINRRFRSDESGIAEIPYSEALINVVMDRYKGYSLFDWALVAERASEIHTVGTGFSYLLEQLDLTALVIHCYKRLPDENHYRNYDYILQKHKYIFH